ncbi:proton-gated ion channel subunit pbo-6-like isoform X2 [Symsagittifera roscoffensis]|uniref:proton-gated ion channel subunit pbo-6-like isoform X2 n=1 Tax=Symsagittifera roscoffensis TaxID=84072 RepID=UPI00307BC6C5
MPQHSFLSPLLQIFIFLNLIGASKSAMRHHQTVRGNLSRHLLEDYDANSGPLYKNEDIIKIQHYLSLQQIVKIDPKTETLHVKLHDYLSWVDQYLSWDREMFRNISQISMKREQIWLPDVFVINQIGRENYYIRENVVPVTVTDEGRVFMDTPQHLRVFCKLEMASFPFDTQTCEIWVGSWTRSESKLELINNKIPCLDTSHYQLNSEWSLEGVVCAEVTVDPLFYQEEGFSRIKYTLTLARRSAFYTRILILPSVLLSCL